MKIGLWLLTVMEAVSMTLNVPQVCPAVPEGHDVPGGVPATNKVVPDNIPIVAASTASGNPGALVFIFSAVTLAAVPVHSAPQFNMYAVLSSLEKTPPTGGSNSAGSAGNSNTGFWLVPMRLGVTTASPENVPLGLPNTSTRLPLWLSATKRAPGTGRVAGMVVVFRFSTSTTP